VIVGAMLALLTMAGFAIDLMIRSKAVRDVPPSVRLNPLNILAHRELWNPAIARANRRVIIAGSVFVGLLLIGLLIGLAL